MIEVHHLNNSRSQRILWLLEELGLPYEIKPYQRDAHDEPRARSRSKKIHPLGKSPVIATATGRDRVGRDPRVHRPQVRQGPARAAGVVAGLASRYLQFMHYAEGSAMLPVMLLLYTGRLGEAGAPLRAAHHERDRQPHRLARLASSPAATGSSATTSPPPTSSSRS